MADPASVMSHESLIISGITVFLMFIGMAASAAYAGAKIALRSVDKQFELFKTLFDSELNAVKSSQAERKVQISELQKDVENRVMLVQCNLERVECGKGRVERICLLSKKIDGLTTALTNQDEKRQQAVAENSKMFTGIQLEISHLKDVANNLSKHSETLERLILSRSGHFRPPSVEDKTS